MKKFYFFLMAMMIGFFADAQLYLCGNDFGWDPANPTVLEPTDGQYKFTTTGGFKLSTNKGDWDTFNANAIGVPSLPKQQHIVADLEPWGENTLPPYDATWTVSVNEDLTQITLDADVAPSTNFDKVYVRGDMNGWGATADWQMATTDGVNYTLAGVAITNKQGFKIADSSYGVINYGGAGSMKFNTEYTLTHNSGTNCKLAESGENLTLKFNVDTHVLIVESEGENPGPGPDPDPEVDYTKWYVNVLGEFNGWKDNGIAATAEGITKHTDLAIGTSPFKIKVYNGKADSYHSNGTEIAQGEWVAIPDDNFANMTIAGATEGQTFDVEFNCATMSIKVTATGENPGPGPEPTYPENVYLIGDDLNNGTWFVNSVALSDKGEGVYTVEDVTFQGASGGKMAYFQFTTILVPAAEGWDKVNDADRYGAPEKDLEATTTAPVPVALYEHNVNAMACEAWSIKPGIYDITLNLKEMTVTIANSDSAVESVEVEENAPAVYYNLQGVKVTEPATGLYIEVRGNSVRKVYVK